MQTSIEVFKTNVKKKKEASKIIKLLSENFPDLMVNFDLEDCDKILRIEKITVSPNEIINILHSKDYDCELL